MRADIKLQATPVNVQGADDLAFEIEILVKNAKSDDDARSLVERTMKMFAGGKRAFVRVHTDTASHLRPDLTNDYRGYARLVVMEREGEWEGSPWVYAPVISLHASQAQGDLQ